MLGAPGCWENPGELPKRSWGASILLFSSAGGEQRLLLDGALALLFPIFISSLCCFSHWSPIFQLLEILPTPSRRMVGKVESSCLQAKKNSFLASPCSTSWAVQLTFLIVFPGRSVKTTFFPLLQAWKAGCRRWKHVWNSSTASSINPPSLCTSPCAGALCPTVSRLFPWSYWWSRDKEIN